MTITRRYCNDEMLRIIGRTIEHVIGRSSKELEGIEAEANVVGNSEGEEKAVKVDDQTVYTLDIIDASGFLHKGSAISSKFHSEVSAQDKGADPGRLTVSASDITATVLKLEQECMRCGVAFSWFSTRRHHCRSCWRAFCADHCSKKALVGAQRFSFLSTFPAVKANPVPLLLISTASGPGTRSPVALARL